MKLFIVGWIVGIFSGIILTAMWLDNSLDWKNEDFWE